MTPEVAIIIGTYNRLEYLKRTLASLERECRIPYVVHVTDAGSTDGTVEFLQGIQSPNVVAHLVGQKLGQAKSLNDVLAVVDTPYVCWLSDDNEVVNRGVDLAVNILRQHPRIGMVGLKTKDTIGRFAKHPYIGGISAIGVLNVNQGVLSTPLLKKLGGFCEEMRDYGIDPDLTTKVLIHGYQVVYTKKVVNLHNRQWDVASEELQKNIQNKQARALEIYKARYSKHLESPLFPRVKIKCWQMIKPVLGALLTLVPERKRGIFRYSSMYRDLFNILNARCICLHDFILCAFKDYYLVQHPQLLSPSTQTFETQSKPQECTSLE